MRRAKQKVFCALKTVNLFQTKLCNKDDDEIHREWGRGGLTGPGVSEEKHRYIATLLFIRVKYIPLMVYVLYYAVVFCVCWFDECEWFSFVSQLKLTRSLNTNIAYYLDNLYTIFTCIRYAYVRSYVRTFWLDGTTQYYTNCYVLSDGVFRGCFRLLFGYYCMMAMAQ